MESPITIHNRDLLWRGHGGPVRATWVHGQLGGQFTLYLDIFLRTFTPVPEKAEIDQPSHPPKYG